MLNWPRYEALVRPDHTRGHHLSWCEGYTGQSCSESTESTESTVSGVGDKSLLDQNIPTSDLAELSQSHTVTGLKTLHDDWADTL